MSAGSPRGLHLLGQAVYHHQLRLKWGPRAWTGSARSALSFPPGARRRFAHGSQRHAAVRARRRFKRHHCPPQALAGGEKKFITVHPSKWHRNCAGLPPARSITPASSPRTVDCCGRRYPCFLDSTRWWCRIGFTLPNLAGSRLPPSQPARAKSRCESRFRLLRQNSWLAHGDKSLRSQNLALPRVC